MRSARTWARSYCACCTSHVSALPPKTLNSLTAISGDMPRLPFTSSESVLRVTPRASAACVMVKPKGSIHSCNTTMPGWGGFFMGMDSCLRLVVIDIINVLRFLVKAENHSPVGAYRHRPEAFQCSLKQVQSEPWQVHMANRRGGVKGRQNIFQLSRVFRVHSAWIVQLKEPFQSLVAETFYHLEM